MLNNVSFAPPPFNTADFLLQVAGLFRVEDQMLLLQKVSHRFVQYIFMDFPQSVFIVFTMILNEFVCFTARFQARQTAQTFKVADSTSNTHGQTDR